jgi:TPP-dependent pyruvate/acetoin dehydrogenase alpha subunit
MELKTTLSDEEKQGLQADKEAMRQTFYLMLLVRRFEERVAEMYTRAKVGGFVHLNIGEEATVVGSVTALYLAANSDQAQTVLGGGGAGGGSITDTVYWTGQAPSWN